MKNPIIQNANGKFRFYKTPKNWNTDYATNLIRYLNLINPLFDKAKKKSQFEFISTLIAFRGLEDPGWDPFENTIEIFESIGKLKVKGEVQKINLFLWVYGHIIEASEPYEIFANFFRIIDGRRYSITNFPDKNRGKHKVPQFPPEKIEILTEIANKVNMADCLIPIKEIYDRDLRNGIFHSDYSIYDGGVRVHRNYKELNRDQTYLLINKALAYFEAIKYLYKKSISDYTEPIEIDLPKGFHSKKGIVMVRKGYGVIGVKDNWKKEQLTQGLIPFRIGKFKWHELKILERDQTISFLPYDKTQDVWDTYKRLRKLTPKFLRKHLNDWYDKKIKETEKKIIINCIFASNKKINMT